MIFIRLLLIVAKSVVLVEPITGQRLVVAGVNTEVLKEYQSIQCITVEGH